MDRIAQTRSSAISGHKLSRTRTLLKSEEASEAAAAASAALAAVAGVVARRD